MALRGPAEPVFTCTGSSCAGADQRTQQVFRALQAELNRFIGGAVTNKTIASMYLLSDIDGKLGPKTVDAFKFAALGIEGKGGSLPVGRTSATKNAIAANAEAIAHTLRALSDTNGWDPASVALPNDASAPVVSTVSQPAVMLPGELMTEQARIDRAKPWMVLGGVGLGLVLFGSLLASVTRRRTR